MPRTLSIGIILFLFTVAFIFQIRHHHPRVPSREGEMEDATGALQSLTFWTRSRAYPLADIPADKYYRAYQAEMARRAEKSGAAASATSWQPIGPTNLQGRSLSVAINPLNPNTVYLGSASGGLWRSRNGGLGGDWQRVTLGYPALGISAIAIDPTDTSIIFLGTGEVYDYQTAYGGLVIRTTRGSYGIGILKTTNSGTSWTKSLDWTYNQQRGIQALKMNPLNPHTIWAATTEGIYKSVDAGSSWNPMLTVLMGEDLVINTNDTNKVMASCGNFASTGAGVYRSTNGGSSWLQLSGVPAYSGKTMLSMYAANPNIVYASSADSTTGVGRLLRTTDFGANWTVMSDNTTNAIYEVQGWYSHYVIVHKTDSSLIIHNGVSRSKSVNGGTTFSSVSSGYSDNHGYAVHPTNPNIVYVANDNGIYRSTNFGSSYSNVGAGMQTGQFYNGFSNSSTDPNLAIGQSQDHIPGYRYVGSTTWDHSTVVDESGWTAIDQSNDFNMYAVDRYGGNMYRSTDRGVSFSGAASLGGNGSWNSPFVVAPSNPAVLYFGDNMIYKSVNSGSSWSPTDAGIFTGNTALSMAISSTSSDTLFVGMAPLVSGAGVYRTLNGGSSWTNVTGSLPNRYPLDLAVDPTDSRIVYAAFGGFGTGHLFKSTNTGSSWTNMTGTLPDVPTSAIAIDPVVPNDIYVGNDLGVYVSSDGGSTWSDYSNGLPDAIIAADVVVSRANRAIRIATHGNGVYDRELLHPFNPSLFDYSALTFNSPLNGSTMSLDSTLDTIRASFKNLGGQLPPDSFFVQIRILQGASEVYASMKKIPALTLGETRQVTFDGSFIPPDSGHYSLQAISMAPDQNTADDTLAGSLTVIKPGRITKSFVSKFYAPYSEITGGSPGPVGDDDQVSRPLPFPFKFDAIDYDSIQISTNGWVEFGTGVRGSVEGLSTAAQLGGTGANQNGAMFITSRPTKALGVWWEDLNAYEPDGSVTYKTLGSAPNRVFVIQWKDMLAYYDPNSTTTYINFQIRLYETSNIIQYRYGPVVAGTFGGPDIGAMMGMKDDISGDFHYYDIALKGTGYSTQGITNLSPLTNWPGPDSCIQIGADSGVVAKLAARWNLVSVPVNRQDNAVASVFPTAVGGIAHGYINGHYQQTDSLVPGKGYWAKFPSSIDQLIAGFQMPSLLDSVQAGWNLVGSVDHEVAAPSGGLVSSNFFSYSGGYRIATTLQPGKGYWVKATSGGTITLGPSASPKAGPIVLDKANSVTITDQVGRAQTLYFAEENDHAAAPEQFEMPPPPPMGMFDARFVSNRILEIFPHRLASAAGYPIAIQSAVYPLTIEWNIAEHDTKQFRIEASQNGKIVSASGMKGSGKMSVVGSITSLVVTVEEGRELPIEFSLEQNYPNPFNPTTTIRYGLPRAAHVTLSVFDILGREVTTLVNENQESGFKSISFDAGGFASGVYLYRLEAGPFTQLRKMVVIK